MQGTTEGGIYDADVTGIANFNKPKYPWATKIYDKMLELTWFPAEADLSNDKKAYNNLTEAQRRAYDLAFGRVILLDSVATNNLMDNVNPYIHDPIVNACGARNSFEESLHSKSYAVMAEDVCEDSEGIYELWRTDPVLLKLVNNLKEIYSLPDNPSVENLALSNVASICLEGIHFLPSFMIFFKFADTMLGTKQMITWIARDELSTHLPLQTNIFKQSRRDYPELNTPEFEDKVNTIVRQVVDVEKEAFAYMTKDLLGFSESICHDFVEHIADKRLMAMGMLGLYGKPNTLKSMWDKFFNFNEIKGNFFETKAVNYAKGKLDMGGDW